MASQNLCYLKEQEGSFAIDENNNATVVDQNGVPLGPINIAAIDFAIEYAELDVNGVIYVLHIPQKAQETVEEEEKYFEWNSTTDLLYLDLYEKYKPLIGKRFRTKHKMFSQICADMRSAPYNYKINEEQVKNHDKTIQRRMKKYFQNTGPRSTGDQRRSILNEKKVLEVYGKQHHITPDYVLSREGECSQEDLFKRATIEQGTEADLEEEKIKTSSEFVNEQNTSSLQKSHNALLKKRENRTASSLNAVKECIEIQNDKLQERSEMYKKLIDMNENWMKESLKLREEANLERKRRNDLLQEHNDLLKQLLSKK